MTTSINEWLNQKPVINEIFINEDGSQYIPIGIVEQLLDDATDKTWGTRNFVFCTKENGFVSASIELLFLDRILVGGITFHLSDYPNNNDFVGIAISECIKNAAKKLGDRFGRSLNGRTERLSLRSSNLSTKMKPDAKVMQQYMLALTINDDATIERLTSIYEINIGE